MLPSFGLAGAKSNGGLPLQAGRPIFYPAGPFRSEMGAALWVKLAQHEPDQLFMGLLISAPDPDGEGHEELSADRYVRQPVTLVGLDLRRRAIPEGVLFDLGSGSPDVTHLGLFNLTGRLAYYGALISPRRAMSPAETVELPPYAARVRRI